MLTIMFKKSYSKLFLAFRSSSAFNLNFTSYVASLALLTGVFLGVLFSFVVHTPTAEARSQRGAERAYPGGPDEEDLQVQSELVEPTARMDRRTLERRILDEIVKSNNQNRENSSSN